MEVITDPDIYINGILKEIERLKEKKVKSLYRVNDKITKRVANYTETYFKNTPEYHIEMKKCARCNNDWDVIITFK